MQKVRFVNTKSYKGKQGEQSYSKEVQSDDF